MSDYLSAGRDFLGPLGSGTGRFIRGDATAEAWDAAEPYRSRYGIDSLPTLDILICSVWARHDQLVALLDHLAPQLEPFGGRARVLLNVDDARAAVGAKRNQLMLAATARHTCFLDDDDRVSDTYIDRIMEALVDDPDYCGFRVKLTVDGYEQKPVIHSLTYPEWSEDEHGYYRGVSHLNPIRRTAALTGLPFQPGFGEDKAWADRVAASGLVKREVFIPEALYHYQYSTSGSLFAGGPRHLGSVPELPEYAHVANIRPVI